MNIFFTHSSPAEAARALDDKRVNKMIIETAQLLSTALRLLEYPGADRLYRATHDNHPCTLWLLESPANMRWTLRHLEALDEVRRKRRGKLWTPHKTCTDILPHLQSFVLGGHLSSHRTNFAQTFKRRDMTPFPRCVHESLDRSFRTRDDRHTATLYRQTMNIKWSEDKRPPTWTNSVPPHWANFERQQAA